MIGNYYKPTPKIWRQIGDSFLAVCTVISTFVPQMPLPDKDKVWAMLILNVIGALGKTFTNFFKVPADAVTEADVNTNNNVVPTKP